ncbi:MAG: Imm27 family immunity protein [Actinomycetota bacterium]
MTGEEEDSTSMSRDELTGNEALRYREEHLTKVRVDSNNWAIEYVDEKTGERWIMDFPQGYLQGGGPPRLRKIGKADGD